MRTSSLLRLAGAFAAVTATSARADGIAMTERPGQITEATAIVDATPEQIYDLVTDYANWRNVLSDIQSVSVEAGGRHHAHVRFKSRALQHEVTVQFDNVPGRQIRFQGIKGPPGGRASGEFLLEPIDAHHTKVTAKLYMDVVGVPSIFVRSSTIRAMREQKLRSDMTDVVSHFASRPKA
jgi:ribosome-associated toxin RatA of RatAB toxin-antitoxin module